jgi:hypothetical protein
MIALRSARLLVLLGLLLGGLAGLAGCSSGHIGSFCESDDDCTDRAAYCATVNICTQACTVSSASTAGGCPEGSRCTLRYGRQVCLATCAVKDDCGSNQRCLDGLCQVDVFTPRN